MKKRIRFMQGAGFALTALAISFTFGSCSKNDNVPPPAPVVLKHISFSELKALTTVPANTKISGIVLSDAAHGNIESNTLVLQEKSGGTGLVVAFSAAAPTSLNPGDSVQINVSGKTVGSVNGETVLQNILPDSVRKISSTTITPSKSNIADITKNASAYDGTLVTIPANSLAGTTGGTAWNGTLTVKDSTGTTSSVVQSGATFAGTDLPASVSSMTGIVRINGTAVDINVRNTGDAVIGGITRVITDNFINLTPSDPGGLGRWKFGFTTSVGRWPGSKSAWWVWESDTTADKTFTNANQQYLYLLTSGNPTFIFDYNQYIYSAISFSNSSAQNPDGINTTGLKQVSITYAGSAITGNLPALSTQGIGYGTAQILPFNSAIDYFQLEFYPQLTSDGSIEAYGTNVDIYTPKVTQTGLFTTVTWKVPTVPQIQAALATAGKTLTAAQITTLTNWVAQPQFQIYNNSYRSGATSVSQQWVPIIISQIQFGY